MNPRLHSRAARRSSNLVAASPCRCRTTRHRQMGRFPNLAYCTVLIATHVRGANVVRAAPAQKAEEQLTFLEAEPQPSPHSAGRIGRVHNSEESASEAPWPDPEEVTSLSVTRLKQLLAPLQSPNPLASPEPKPAAASRPTDEMLRTDRGVLLSTPLSMDEKAKAMTEMATTMCTNTCASSHDGVCSDGASKSFCTEAEAFPPAGRGECAAAEGSECELGSDCAPRPLPSLPAHPTTRPKAGLRSNTLLTLSRIPNVCGTQAGTVGSARSSGNRMLTPAACPTRCLLPASAVASSITTLPARTAERCPSGSSRTGPAPTATRLCSPAHFATVSCTTLGGP